MHKSIRGVMAVLLALLLAFPVTALAAGTPPPKDEVVYINLNASGAVEGIYVVNCIYHGQDSAVLGDYGDYSAVKNLTTTQPLVVTDGRVGVQATEFETKGDRFYYQGTLANSTVLPWGFSIAYRLDGVDTTPVALAGASGSLAIELSVATRDNADALYKEHFALQASLSLDGERCKEIAAAGATIANAGESKQISYTLLPGSSKTYTITAEVTDFEFDGIQIAAVPFNIELDRPNTDNFKTQLNDIKDGVTELDDGAAELDDGVAALYDGAWELRDGAADLNDGVYQMVDGLPALQGGAAELRGGFAQLAAFAAFLPQDIPHPAMPNPQAAYTEALGQLSGGFDAYASGVDELGYGVRALYSGTQGLREGTERLYEGVAELKDGTAELTDGTSRFRDETTDIDGKIDEEIDKLMEQYSKGEARLSSFVSPQNNNIASLQFVMRTEGIYKEEVVTATAEPVPPDTLWQRVLKLFS